MWSGTLLERVGLFVYDLILRDTIKTVYNAEYNAKEDAII